MRAGVAWGSLPSIACLAAALVGCGGGASPGGGSISTQPLSGKINGVAWTFAVGETDFFLSSTSTTFFTNLYDVPLDAPCAGGFPSASQRALIFGIPKAVGSYGLSLSDGGFTATFTYKQNDANNDYQNDIATSGSLDVTALTATTLTGGAHVTIDAANYVDGQFQVAICPS